VELLVQSKERMTSVRGEIVLNYLIEYQINCESGDVFWENFIKNMVEMRNGSHWL
jgi:N-glycosylase/DNA lyase